MSEKEGKVLKIYDGSRAREEDLYDLTWVNQAAWTLAVVLAGVAIWLAIALVHAENQRFAMASGKCADPVFRGSFDQKCMAVVNSRDHWWEHLWYGVTHVLSEAPKQ